MGDDGHGEEEIGVSNDGQKEKNKTKELKAGDIKNAFSTPNKSSVADLLVIPGDDPLGIAMRTVLKRHSEGMIQATAYARDWAEMEEFGDKVGQNELLFKMAIMPSIDGLAREQLVRAIIGDKEFKSSRNFVDKLKDAAFGSKEDKGA